MPRFPEIKVALDELRSLDGETLARFGLGGNPRLLLLEFPYYGWPLALPSIVAGLRAAGTVPLLAPPERNSEVQETPERLRPLGRMAGSALAGPDFVALHMAWGAINEWTTQAGYAQLARRADHPVLRELVKRIMRQEGRHIDFYASQAEKRLAASRRARKLTRFALRKLWSPVGSGVMPAAETEHLARYLFGSSEGLDAARRIDRRVDRLPGLAGLRLLEGSLAA